MKRRLGILVGASLLLWGLVTYPSRILWGDSAVVFSAVALALCLVPAAGTLLLGRLAFGQSPEDQLLAVMAGTVVRMVVVLGLGLVLFSSLPYFHRAGFWFWVLSFYLFTLTLEIALLLGFQAKAKIDQPLDE